MVIDCRVDGPIFCERFAVVIGAGASVVGDVIAREIVVLGSAAGKLVATETVDVRAEGRVIGTVISPRFILDPAAHFEGRVEPQHLDAALRVARFEQKQQDAARADRTRNTASLKTSDAPSSPWHTTHPQTSRSASRL